MKIGNKKLDIHLQQGKIWQSPSTVTGKFIFLMVSIFFGSIWYLCVSTILLHHFTLVW